MHVCAMNEYKVTTTRVSAIDQWLDPEIPRSGCPSASCFAELLCLSSLVVGVATVGRVEQLDKNDWTDEGSSGTRLILVQYRRRGSTKISGKMCGDDN